MIILVFLNVLFFVLVIRFYYRENKNDPEPLRYLVLVTVLGVFAFLLSGSVRFIFSIIEYQNVQIALSQSIDIDPIQIVLVIPLSEEILKNLILYLFYRSNRDRFDTLLDGLVYGALLGSGFSIAEGLLYSIRTFYSVNFTQALTITLFRGVLMLVGHPLFTGIFGYGLVYSRIGRKNYVYKYFFFGLMFHFFWNFLSLSPFFFNTNFYFTIFLIVSFTLLELSYIVYLILYIHDVEKQLEKRGYYKNKRAYRLI